MAINYIFNTFWAFLFSPLTRNPFRTRAFPIPNYGTTRRVQERQMDDILIWQRDERGRDKCLKDVLRQIQAEGITFNAEKCYFSTRYIKFLGHEWYSKGWPREDRSSLKDGSSKHEKRITISTGDFILSGTPHPRQGYPIGNPVRPFKGRPRIRLGQNPTNSLWKTSRASETGLYFENGGLEFLKLKES